MSFVPRIPANQVLVTVGTGCLVSAIGTTETHRAANINDPHMIGFAAFDARLVDIDPKSPIDAPVFLQREGEHQGRAISVQEIEARWGNRLREEMGSRVLPQTMMAAHVPTNIGAPLPHDFERGGLRARAGFGFQDFRKSPLADMALLFEDDPRLGPSLQSQMFLYSGLGALAALPKPLSQLIPDAYRFRVAAAACFQGHEAWEALNQSMQKISPVDRFAYRLASTLNTHGPALLNAVLSPSYPLKVTKQALEKDSDYLNRNLVRDPRKSYMRNVPQAPLVSSAACASALVNFCDIAPHLQLSATRRYGAPVMALWTSADAALSPNARILEGFGPGAMMTAQKLEKLGRPVSEALFPFDADASKKDEDKIPLGGTLVGNGGYGILVTTLPFALAHFLDITSVIVGWGQSGETGGKAHFGGVGYGGENAVIAALMMAFEDHGFGVNDFEHLFAHATGTSTNSKTDLGTVLEARRAAAQEQGYGEKEKLRRMRVSAPKAAIPGPGHPMGPAGHLATDQGNQYLMGRPTVGIPTLRKVDPQLASEMEHFEISKDVVFGNGDGGEISPVQGFGGYVAAVARRSANPDVLKRYSYSHDHLLSAYLERWPQIRREREESEARFYRTRGSALAQAVHHRWPGAK